MDGSELSKRRVYSVPKLSASPAKRKSHDSPSRCVHQSHFQRSAHVGATRQPAHDIPTGATTSTDAGIWFTRRVRRRPASITHALKKALPELVQYNHALPAAARLTAGLNSGRLTLRRKRHSSGACMHTPSSAPKETTGETTLGGEYGRRTTRQTVFDRQTFNTDAVELLLIPGVALAMLRVAKFIRSQSSGWVARSPCARLEAR